MLIIFGCAKISKISIKVIIIPKAMIEYFELFLGFSTIIFLLIYEREYFTPIKKNTI